MFWWKQCCKNLSRQKRAVRWSENTLNWGLYGGCFRSPPHAEEEASFDSCTRLWQKDPEWGLAAPHDRPCCSERSEKARDGRKGEGAGWRSRETIWIQLERRKTSFYFSKKTFFRFVEISGKIEYFGVIEAKYDNTRTDKFVQKHLSICMYFLRPMHLLCPTYSFLTLRSLETQTCTALHVRFQIQGLED